jgi:hypothetical protein
MTINGGRGLRVPKYYMKIYHFYLLNSDNWKTTAGRPNLVSAGAFQDNKMLHTCVDTIIMHTHLATKQEYFRCCHFVMFHCKHKESKHF